MATLDKVLRADWLVGLTNWLHNNSECDDGPNGDECCAPCYDLALRLGRIANRAWGGDLEVVADPTLEVETKPCTCPPEGISGDCEEHESPEVVW